MRVNEFITSSSTKQINNKVGYITLTGSKGYGIDIEDSDTDYRGFYLPSKEDILLMNNSTKSIKCTETDKLLYSLPQLIHLLKQNNPNVIELFGTRKEDILCNSNEGKMIKKKLDLFLSKKIVTPILGTVKSYEKSYEKDNNPKHIANALRLLYMGEEVLLEGQVNTYRENDRDLLLAIRLGEVSLTEMKILKTNGIYRLKEAERKTYLQDEPKYREIDNLLMAIHQNIVIQGVMEG